MKKFKRIIASFVTVLALLAITPVTAHAEWKSDSNGWWNTEGSSYSTGWKQIGGNWYYFYSDGYMAHDEYVGGYYLNSAGAWTTSVPVKTSSSNVSTSNDQSQTVYITATGKKYHAIPKCGNTKSSRPATLEEAQKLGLGPCSKCY